MKVKKSPVILTFQVWILGYSHFWKSFHVYREGTRITIMLSKVGNSIQSFKRKYQFLGLCNCSLSKLTVNYDRIIFWEPIIMTHNFKTKTQLWEPSCRLVPCTMKDHLWFSLVINSWPALLLKQTCRLVGKHCALSVLQKELIWCSYWFGSYGHSTLGFATGLLFCKDKKNLLNWLYNHSKEYHMYLQDCNRPSAF